MKLSIVIVNWNTRDLVARCLATVQEATQTNHRSSASMSLRAKVETFVVDNASTDGSVAMITERFRWVRLIGNTENVGFSRANNRALGLVSGDFILLLNSDTEVRTGALETLMQTLDSHPEAGAVGPRVLNPNGSLQNSYGSLPTVLDELLGPYWGDFFSKPWGLLGRRLHRASIEEKAPRPVDRVSFACTMIRREALEQVGLLDERFAFYSEDYDWFKRLKDAGWRTLFCPQAQVVHHWGASSRQQSEWSMRQLYRSKRLYFDKHYGTVAETVLRIGFTCRFLLKMLPAALKYPFDRQASLHQMALYRTLSQDMLRSLSQCTRSV